MRVIVHQQQREQEKERTRAQLEGRHSQMVVAKLESQPKLALLTKIRTSPAPP